MKLKVCGITSKTQLHQLDELGVDFAGLIFYEKSPRYVLKHGLTGSMVKSSNLALLKVGVFVNATFDEILSAIQNYGLDKVQLHGTESPMECGELSKIVPVIKAVRLAENESASEVMERFENSIEMMLFDSGKTSSKECSKEHNEYGGTGIKFNWNGLKEHTIEMPYFLSGGIGPGDAVLIKEFIKDPVAKNLFAIDINSRFEKSPGLKNMEEISQFLTEIRPLGN